MSTHLASRENATAIPTAWHLRASRAADQVKARVLLSSPAPNPTPALLAFAGHASSTKRKRRAIHLMSGINVVAVAEANSREVGDTYCSDGPYAFPSANTGILLAT